jgi:hypothetical protein
LAGAKGLSKIRPPPSGKKTVSDWLGISDGLFVFLDVSKGHMGK